MNRRKAVLGARHSQEVSTTRVTLWALSPNYPPNGNVQSPQNHTAQSGRGDGCSQAPIRTLPFSDPRASRGSFKPDLSKNMMPLTCYTSGFE